MCWIQLSAKAQAVFDVLWAMPFDAEQSSQKLDEMELSAQELSLCAFKFLDECRFDTHEHIAWPVTWPNRLEQYQSSALYQVFSVLLAHGLDPNMQHEHTSLLNWLRHFDNGYVSADSAALLLSHGADPNRTDDGCNLIRDVNTDIGFDLINQEVRHRFDALCHYWFVLLGYGAKLENGETPLDLCAGFTVEQLKNHRNYYIGRIHSVGENYTWEICIFDRGTNIEVARY